MSFQLSHSYLIFLFTIVLSSCAKRQSITGGPKDEIPPKLLRATPPNKSTNFTAKEIKLTFDELVTLEKPDQQILISPPMKNKPEIKPLGYATKTIKIKFNDTLLPNTTYAINFGNSIVDYNEKNSFEFFQYVFSTGSQLDSLSFKGSVKDLTKQKLEDRISVFLYEENETIKDSIVYNELPLYISSTIDSTNTFTFNYLKEGTYRLIALNDKNNNYKFDPKREQIAFLDKAITIPQDTTAALGLFKELQAFRFSRAKQLSKNQFQIGYFGEISDPKIEILGSFPDILKLETRLTKEKNKDTLNFWVKPFFEQDSLLFKATSEKVIDTITTRYKDQNKDSLTITNKGTKLKLKQAFELTANTPLNKLEEALITLVDADTIPVNFTQKWDAYNNQISINFPKKENTAYKIKLLPNTISDFLGNTNLDTLNYTLTTLRDASYGNLNLTFSNLPEGIPLIIQLFTSKKMDQEVLLKASKDIAYTELTPGDYIVKVIYDLNNNGKWDTGNYLNKLQPEPIYFYEKPITVRANWDVQQNIELPNINQ